MTIYKKESMSMLTATNLLRTSPVSHATFEIHLDQPETVPGVKYNYYCESDFSVVEVFIPSMGLCFGSLNPFSNEPGAYCEFSDRPRNIGKKNLYEDHIVKSGSELVTSELLDILIPRIEAEKIKLIALKKLEIGSLKQDVEPCISMLVNSVLPTSATSHANFETHLDQPETIPGVKYNFYCWSRDYTFSEVFIPSMRVYFCSGNQCDFSDRPRNRWRKTFCGDSELVTSELVDIQIPKITAEKIELIALKNLDIRSLAQDVENYTRQFYPPAVVSSQPSSDEGTYNSGF